MNYDILRCSNCHANISATVGYVVPKCFRCGGSFDVKVLEVRDGGSRAHVADLAIPGWDANGSPVW